MKLFSWVHNKLNGRQSTINNTNINASTKNQAQHLGGQKEEFSDWPQGFLSIGTLFTKSSKENIKDQNNESSQNATLDLTMEEVKELQKELRTLISSDDINCISSLDGDKESNNVDNLLVSNKEDEEQEPNDQDFTTIVTNNNSKDIYLDNNASKVVIGKKSLSFLLKKVFICGYSSGSLGPTPSLRDPMLSVAPKTKISKILRALLRKKIYPQNSCSNNTSKKFLGMSGPIGISKYDDEDDFDTGRNTSSKWDKSDTEYIVLEI